MYVRENMTEICHTGLPVMQPPHQSLTEKIGLSAMVSRQKGHEGQRLTPKLTFAVTFLLPVLPVFKIRSTVVFLV